MFALLYFVHEKSLQHLGENQLLLQDVIKNAKDLGLGVWMRHEPAVRDMVRLCCIIPLAPQHQLRDAFMCIRNVARGTEFYHDLRDFLDYVWRTWLTGVRFDVLSVCHSVDRTNNASESFNRKLQLELGDMRHPNIWNFLSKFMLTYAQT